MDAGLDALSPGSGVQYLDLASATTNSLAAGVRLGIPRPESRSITTGAATLRAGHVFNRILGPAMWRHTLVRRGVSGLTVDPVAGDPQQDRLMSYGAHLRGSCASAVSAASP